MRKDEKYIVFVGRPNTGKSTLIKLLTGIKTKIGKKPGATRKLSFFRITTDLSIVDLPGFGYMHGVSKEKIEKTKKMIIEFLEKYNHNVILAFHIIDGSTYSEIKARLERKGIRSFDEELSFFLRELKIDTITVINKIDKLKDESEVNSTLDLIRKDLQIFDETIVPVSAKKMTNLKILRKLAILKLREKGIRNIKAVFK